MTLVIPAGQLENVMLLLASCFFCLLLFELALRIYGYQYDPWLDSEAQEYPHETAHHIVKLEAQRAGFATMDFTRRFMDVGPENLKLRPDDLVHPNDAGPKNCHNMQWPT